VLEILVAFFRLFVIGKLVLLLLVSVILGLCAVSVAHYADPSKHDRTLVLRFFLASGSKMPERMARVSLLHSRVNALFTIVGMRLAGSRIPGGTPSACRLVQNPVPLEGVCTCAYLDFGHVEKRLPVIAANGGATSARESRSIHLHIRNSYRVKL
jgi:hypothetical protein